MLSGIQTRLGWFQGIDWDRRTASSLALVHETMTSLQRRGWVMLVTSALNYEAARTLAMRPAECETVPADPSTIAPALRQAQEPARLLTANGVYPIPQPGERFGDFIWHPSQSTEVIGQVAEFMWGKDTNWGLTRLLFLPPSETKVSSGQLMSGGRTVWRVWSINKFGDVVFSEPHSFGQCPVPAACR